jgi:hypothetical protein
LDEALSEFLGKPVDSAEIISKLEERLFIDSNYKVTDPINLLQHEPAFTDDEEKVLKLLRQDPILTDKEEDNYKMRFISASRGVSQLRKIQIFLASSEELRDDRDEFEIYFRQLNDDLLGKGLYLVIYRWENFLDAMSETRLQDEYNTAVRNCDIFVSLFSTKTGKFTEEEFDTAYQQFKNTGKPFIYTFFKDTMININDIQEHDLQSLMAFKKRLNNLGHFYTTFANIEDLKLRFHTQLDKLLEGPLRR